MIQKGYTLRKDRPIMRLTVDGERVCAEMYASVADVWLVEHYLDREHVLELRDTLDRILMDWFCEKPKTLCPICEREYGGIVPIVFDPADVGRLDMGEPPERPVGLGDEDEIEGMRRQT